MQLISKAVGIDLGTTNSAVAVMNPSDTEIVIHRDHASRRETTPSCVWKNPKTGEIVIGHQALRRVGASPSPVRSIKRQMGQKITVRLTNESVTPEQVSAAILGEMKRQIEEDVAQFGSESARWIVDRAIVTVPAYFDQPQIDATRKAATLAGLELVDLLHEPTAAACHYCWKAQIQDGLFLVYDLGGGTFDVTVLRASAGMFEVLGVSGNNVLGGDDMDTALAEYLLARLRRENSALDLDVKNDPEDRLRFDTLRFLAEGVKKALSTSNEFLLRDTSSLKDKDGLPVVIETMFERSEVDEILRPVVERTIPYCHKALEIAQEKAAVSLSDVDAVILAGGSTHVPLVRDMVRREFCAGAGEGPRAKCAEPVYEKVDTVVALGAAIRAAAIGGLAVTDSERTVRIRFRGNSSTARGQATVGGVVEALDSRVDLRGGRMRLTIAESDYDVESELAENGTFSFMRVPLSPGAENLLSFEVLGSNGGVLASAGRPITHSREAVRPTGGAGSTAVLSKALSIIVSRGGEDAQKELIPALATLPTEAHHTFSHQGDTELVLIPVYQGAREIQKIQVKVPSTLPKGTPIELNIHVDELSYITVKGKIGGREFAAAIEPPPPPPPPKREDLDKLEPHKKKAEAYLSRGKQAVFNAQFARTKASCLAALDRGETAQAIHDFEELQELVSQAAAGEKTLKPPKAAFDSLLSKVRDINEAVARAAQEAGKPHPKEDFVKTIDVQAEQGEKAWAASDQRSYSDVLKSLESLRQHLIERYQEFAPEGGGQSKEDPVEEAVKHARAIAQMAVEVAELAAADGRHELEKECLEIHTKALELEQEAPRDARRVEHEIARQYSRLEQVRNILVGGRSKTGAGKYVEDHAAGT